MEEETQEQSNNRPWLFKKGQPSPNPGGRPKGSKSLKTRAREYLEGLNEEESIAYFEGLNKLDVWKMAEGNPHSTEDSKLELIVPKPLLDALRNNNSNTQDIQPKEEN